MSLSTGVTDLATAVGAKIKSVDNSLLLVPNDAVATKPLYVYANSYGAIPRVWGIAERYPERLASRLKSGLVVRGVGGAMAHDIAKYLYGSFTVPIQVASTPA